MQFTLDVSITAGFPLTIPYLLVIYWLLFTICTFGQKSAAAKRASGSGNLTLTVTLSDPRSKIDQNEPMESMETLLLSSVSALWLASDASGHNGTRKIWTRNLSEPCSVRHEPSLTLTQRFTKQLVPWGADVPPYSKGPRVSSYSAGSSTRGSASCRVALRPPLPWVFIIISIIIITITITITITIIIISSSSIMIMIIILEIAHMFVEPDRIQQKLTGPRGSESAWDLLLHHSKWVWHEKAIENQTDQHLPSLLLAATHSTVPNTKGLPTHSSSNSICSGTCTSKMSTCNSCCLAEQPTGYPNLPVDNGFWKPRLEALGWNGIRIVSKKKQSCQHGGCSAPERNLETSGREHFAANVWNWFILIVPKCSNAQVCTSDDRLEYLEIASHRWLHFPSTPERNSRT